MAIKQLKTLNLGITGLSRAGKTVFTTSLIHNLCCAASYPDRMPLLKAASERRLLGVTVDPPVLEKVPIFPRYDNYEAMSSSPPKWPESTEGISEITIRIRFSATTKAWLWGSDTPTEYELPIRLIDYPGEWLIDLPLINLDFAEWSDRTISAAKNGERARFSTEWLSYLETLVPEAPPAVGETKRAHVLYCDYLKCCREQLHLNYLQPGRFVNAGDTINAPFMWFCPLPTPSNPIHAGTGTLYGLMRARYDTYREIYAKDFLTKNFSTINRQIILVDILGALSAGKESFDDMTSAIRDICEIFRYDWFSSLFSTSIDKVLVAATKSDHVNGIQIDHLTNLLQCVVDDMPDGAKSKTATMAVSSVVCTREEVRDGVVMVVGRIIGDQNNSAVIIPHITTVPPTDEYWKKYKFSFPRFEPQILQSYDIEGIRHINLDKALEYLIGDKLGS